MFPNTFDTAGMLLSMIILNAVLFSILFALNLKTTSKITTGFAFVLCSALFIAITFFFLKGLRFILNDKIALIFAAAVGIIFLVVISLFHCGHRKLLFLLLAAYTAGLIYITFICRLNAPVSSIKINVIESAKYLNPKNGLLELEHFLLNIVLFVPFGFLHYLAVRKNVVYSATISLLLSGIVETMQLLLHAGQCDILDIITNTAGGIVGIILAAILIKAVKKKDNNGRLIKILKII